MPPAEPPRGGAGPGGGGSESSSGSAERGSDAGGEVVVWRLGGALLAAALDEVVEVALVTGDGRARTRSGSVSLSIPAGLDIESASGRAVVLTLVGGRTAVPADEVEGVVAVGVGAVAPPPSWLAPLARGRLRGLVRLGDGRIAALLDLDALAGPG